MDRVWILLTMHRLFKTRPWIQNLSYTNFKHTPSIFQVLAMFQGITSSDFIHQTYDCPQFLSAFDLSGILLPNQAQDQRLQELFSTVLWAAPKKRTSHSKKRLRFTNKWLKPVHHYTFCSQCGNPKLLHVLCGHCFKETMKKTAEYRRNLINNKINAIIVNRK